MLEFADVLLPKYIAIVSIQYHVIVTPAGLLQQPAYCPSVVAECRLERVLAEVAAELKDLEWRRLLEKQTGRFVDESGRIFHLVIWGQGQRQLPDRAERAGCSHRRQGGEELGGEVTTVDG